MRSLSLLLLLAAAPLCAQIDVLYETPAGLAPMPASCLLGTVDTGATLSTRIRAINRGSGAVTIPEVSLAGEGFSLTGLAALPVTLPAGGMLEFSIRFVPAAGEGSYSASFSLGGFTAIVRAVANPTLTLTFGPGGTALTAGGENSIGTIEVGLAPSVGLVVENNASRTLAITSLTADAPLTGLPALPVSLAPGARLALQLQMQPAAPGPYRVAVTLNNRVFTLTATAVYPYLSAATIVLPDGIVASGQQLPVAIRFAQPAPSASGGRLLVTYYSDYASASDPAIGFPAGTSVPFTVAAGETEARFAGQPTVPLQTGTISGRLVLRVEASGVAVERELRTLPQRIVIDDAKVTRQTDTLTVTLSGFDNTRAAASLTFRFYDRSGSPVSNSMLVEPGAAWPNYYYTSGLGGLFRISAVFPVAGDGSLVGSVAVEIANGIARTDLGRVPIP